MHSIQSLPTAHTTYGTMIRTTSAHADAPTPATNDDATGHSVVRGKAPALGGDHGGEDAEVEDDEGTRERGESARADCANDARRGTGRAWYGACVD
jgi:hypothetical protein